MSRAAARSVRSSQVKLMVVRCASQPANDVVDELAQIDAEWRRLHARAFRGKTMCFVVRYELDLIVDESAIVLAHTGRRVEAWRVEMSETIEATDSYSLPNR